MLTRLALVLGCLVVALGSCAPWFHERTFLFVGDDAGLSQGGLLTLACAVVGLVLAPKRPRLVGATMLVALSWAALSAYEMPGSLVANHGGGEAGGAWGLDAVLLASMATGGVAFLAPRRPRVA